MVKKYFTPQEANKRLPLVKQIVGDIIEKGKRVQAIMSASSDVDENDEVMQLQEEIEALMGELEQLGCFYKDWNFQIGLVDFPSRLNGQEVLLCWRSDEPIVRWYHPVDDGYSDRKLIPEDLL